MILREWGLATVRPESRMCLVANYVAVTVFVAACTYPVYGWLGLCGAERRRAALGLAAAGVFADTFAMFCVSTLYPGLEHAKLHLGVWLIWSYGLIAATGWWPRDRPERPESPPRA